MRNLVLLLGLLMTAPTLAHETTRYRLYKVKVSHKPVKLKKCSKRKVRVKYKTRYKIKYRQKKNNLSLLLGASLTRIKTRLEETDTEYRVRGKFYHEADIGLNYSRLVTDSVRLGIIGTHRQHVYLTIGLDF